MDLTDGVEQKVEEVDKPSNKETREPQALLIRSDAETLVHNTELPALVFVRDECVELVVVRELTTTSFILCIFLEYIYTQLKH